MGTLRSMGWRTAGALALLVQALGWASDAVAAPRVTAYAPTFVACRGSGAERIAIRMATVDGRATVLAVDPATLDTALLPLAGLDCRAADPADIRASRFGEAIAASLAGGSAEGAPVLNAGLRRGRQPGVVITGDLCPSPHGLDRATLTALAQAYPGAPVALAATGVWLRSHPRDVDWIKSEVARGAIAVTWVNHTDHHRYVPSLPEPANFLRLPGTNATAEVLGGERALIEAGFVPSVFFRFPGLVADRGLQETVAGLHLVAVGTDAWLALGQRPRPGSIILVHLNGNEPQGTAPLLRLVRQGLPGAPAALADAP
jgi:hypothetical protein